LETTGSLSKEVAWSDAAQRSDSHASRGSNTKKESVVESVGVEKARLLMGIRSQLQTNRNKQGIVPLQFHPNGPINRKQLRRLHALWHRWAAQVASSRDADRRLRHYSVELFTGGRVRETGELNERDAVGVIKWLARLTYQREARFNQVAGTAGRRGYPEHRRIPPNEAAWNALWRWAAKLGMEHGTLEGFIRGHYGGVGLRGLQDIRSMADLNRVLWGLKAMLRHGLSSERSRMATKRAA
jgi:hypothetical protein